MTTKKPKLSREMMRILGFLHRGDTDHGEFFPWTVLRLRRETYAGNDTLKALLNRGLIEYVKPEDPSDAAAYVFTTVRLVDREDVKALAKECWDARDGRLRTALAEGRAKNLAPFVEQELDGRWLATIESLPGCMVYGASPTKAADKARKLAVKIIAEQMRTK